MTSLHIAIVGVGLRLFGESAAQMSVHAVVLFR